MKSTVKIALFLLLSLAFIGCDQATKELAKTHLKDEPAKSYLKETVWLQYAENTGAALNFGDEWSDTASFWLLSMLPLAFLIGLAVYVWKKAGQCSVRKTICLALLFGGGMGNIIDRLMNHRHVTDFMLLKWGSLHTGIFNVADLGVTLGALGLLFFFNDNISNQSNPQLVD